MLKELFYELDISLNDEYDFIVTTQNNVVYVGKDNELILSILIKSNDIKDETILLKTNKLCVELNRDVQYRTLNSEASLQDRFHVIKCLSNIGKEQEIFLDLCDIYFNDEEKKSESVLEIFRTLSDFFKIKKEYSSSYLQGLYGELFVINYLLPSVDITSFWQSKEKLKFDFSVSSNFKLEIKTTTKASRIHHFSHEQLSIMPYSTFIASVMLQYDDKGFSLKTLINEIVGYQELPAIFKVRLLNVLHYCDDSLLEQQKYLLDYTINFLRFYNASVIPKFDDVVGVTRAEYDSDLEVCESIENDIFIEALKNEIEDKYGKNI